MNKTTSPSGPKTPPTHDPYPEPDVWPDDFGPDDPLGRLIDDYATTHDHLVNLDRVHDAITTPEHLIAWIRLHVNALQVASHVGTDTAQRWEVLASLARSAALRLWKISHEGGIEAVSPVPTNGWPTNHRDIVQTIDEWARALDRLTPDSGVVAKQTQEPRRWKKQDLVHEIFRLSGRRISVKTLTRIQRDAEVPLSRKPLSPENIDRLAQEATKRVDTSDRRAIADCLNEIADQSRS